SQIMQTKSREVRASVLVVDAAKFSRPDALAPAETFLKTHSVIEVFVGDKERVEKEIRTFSKAVPQTKFVGIEYKYIDRELSYRFLEGHEEALKQFVQNPPLPPPPPSWLGTVRSYFGI